MVASKPLQKGQQLKRGQEICLDTVQGGSKKKTWSNGFAAATLFYNVQPPHPPLSFPSIALTHSPDCFTRPPPGVRFLGAKPTHPLFFENTLTHNPPLWRKLDHTPKNPPKNHQNRPKTLEFLRNDHKSLSTPQGGGQRPYHLSTRSRKPTHPPTWRWGHGKERGWIRLGRPRAAGAGGAGGSLTRQSSGMAGEEGAGPR